MIHIQMNSYHNKEKLILSNVSKSYNNTLVLEDINITYTIEETSVTISASIGIALAPKDGNTFQELYKKSDIALYYVKNNKKNGYSFYKS